MITKYSTAPAKYDELFKKATGRLNELNITKEMEDGSKVLYNYPDVKIESLEEYFSHLRDLVYGNEETVGAVNPEEGYIFLKLPLDEPHFEINADTRDIKIPDAFNKNGISVVGDEVAEILFFEIDRFYDATDLSQMDIAIQWSHSNDPDNTIYQTPAFISVIESDLTNGDDKLVFGWPISSDITKTAGKINFSVRFYKENPEAQGDEYSLLFSLSTLTRSVSINPGLVYDITGIDSDNRLDLILSKRLQNSPLGEVDPPVVPIFIFSATKEGDEYTNGIVDITDQIVDSVTLATLGFKNDSGSLTYSWYYSDGEQQKLLADWKSPLVEGVYVPVTQLMTAPEGQIIATYFYKDQTGDYYKIILGTNEEFEEAVLNYGTIYINCAAYVLKADSADLKPGNYYAKVRNTLYGKNAFDDGKTKPVWVVYGPETPEITLESWGEAAQLEWFDGLELHVEGNNLDTYHWLGDLTTKTVVDDMEALTFVELESNDGIYSVGDEGYYKVRIINSKNGETKEDESSVVLVLAPIEEFGVSVAREGNILTALVSRNLRNFETIEYAWSSLDDTDTILANTVDYDIQGVEKDYYVTVTISKGEASESVRAFMV